MSVLTERQRLILNAVVEEHISTAEPVGSVSVIRRGGVDCSPATVRNVMGDLEQLGLLTQPHTSAGRVPTDRGFRFYVDSLVKLRKPSSREQGQIEDPFHRSAGVQEAMAQVTRGLSELSQLTGVMSAPKRAQARLHRVELIRLPDGKVLVIVVDQAGLVQNRMVEPAQGEGWEQQQLDEMAEVINVRCRGLTFAEARARVLEEMRQARAEMNRMMSQALALADQVLERAQRNPSDVIVAGESHVLGAPEFAQVDKMKALLRTFEERHVLMGLLDCIEAAPGVQVFIGHENRFQEVADCSVVVAGYGPADAPLGAIGVIGPTRMDYSRMVPLVEFTAGMLTRMLATEETR